MDFKNNTKHRYKTIQGLRSFKNTLPKEVKKILSKKGHIYTETLDNWRSIVGEELFKVCYPKSFKNSNRVSPSHLIIMVKRGHEVDIEYSKKKILNRLNSYLGYNAIEKLKFISFEGSDGVLKENIKHNATNNKYNNEISKIKNEKIKKSLSELSRLFKKNEKS
tara:strand:+ start:386 stop:877 length:492 start_codon:yes stop_codon:yes gene_type:complete